MADIDYESRAKKFQEGWVFHQPGNSKSWTKYWMVLRGMMLFIFTNKETTHESMKGTLTITRDTDIRTLPPDSKKKGFKFELETTSANGDRKVNRLKFDTENDMHLWKSFIFGIANGIVPSDVHLLPGQLKDVHEAIGEVRSTPPPLPSMVRPMTIPRPNLNTNGGPPQPPPSRPDYPEPTMSRFVTGSSVEANGQPRRRPSTGSAGSGDSGGITQQMTRSVPPPSSYPSSTMPPMETGSGGGGGGAGVNNLRELRRRQANLTDVALNSQGTMPHESPGRSWINDPVSAKLHQGENWLFKKPESDSPPTSNLGGTRINHNMAEEKTYTDDFVRPPTRRPDHSATVPRPPQNTQAYQPPPSPQAPPPPEQNFVRPPPHPISTMSREERSDPIPAPTISRHPSVSDFENHLFYLDPARNREYPTWFFNDCSRDEAENVLTVGRQHGNVMMRPSSSFTSTGKYVISMRREIAGGTTLYHYEVAKHGDGFKINVDNHHSPMRCLSEVMDFFVSVAGPGTLPMKMNSRDRIFSKSGGDSHQAATRGGLDNVSSVRPPSFPSSTNQWSSSSSQASGSHQSHLHTTGSVDPTILGAVQDMNSQFTRRDSESRPPQNVGGWSGGEEYQNVPSMHGNDIRHYGMNASEVGREPSRTPSQGYNRPNHDGFPNNGHSYPSDRHANHHEFNSRTSGSSDRSSLTGQSVPPPPPPPAGGLSHDMGRMSLGGHLHYAPMTIHTSFYPGEGVGGPPAPPAPPPPPMGGPPPPPPPPMGGGPAPPPLPGGHPTQGGVPPPPPVSQQPMMRQDSWHDQSQFASPPQSPGYRPPNSFEASQTAARRPSTGAGANRFGGGGLSFEDELKAKLQGKKQEIYDTAQILKNY